MLRDLSIGNSLQEKTMSEIRGSGFPGWVEGLSLQEKSLCGLKSSVDVGLLRSSIDCRVIV